MLIPKFDMAYVLSFPMFRCTQCQKMWYSEDDIPIHKATCDNNRIEFIYGPDLIKSLVPHELRGKLAGGK